LTCRHDFHQCLPRRGAALGAAASWLAVAGDGTRRVVDKPAFEQAFDEFDLAADGIMTSDFLLHRRR